MVALESARGGSKSGRTPRNCHRPCASVRATPSERKPRGKLVDGLLDRRLHLGGIGRQLQDHLRRPFGCLERVPVRALNGRLGAIVHGAEGLIMNHLVAIQGLRVLQPAQHGQVNGVLILRA